MEPGGKARQEKIPDPVQRPLRLLGPGASILYTDLRIKELLENQRREKEREPIKKDAGKF